MNEYYNYPKNIHIEISSKCNLSCCQCKLTYDEYESKNFNLRFDDYKKIIDELDIEKSVNYNILRLQGIGESSLHPDLNKMITYAKEKNIFKEISFITNLLGTNSKEYIKYLENGLDTLIISLDSINQETLNFIRTGTNIKKFIQNLCDISKYHFDKLSIATSVSKYTITELEEIAKLLIRLKIKSWQLQPMVNWGYTLIKNRNIVSNEDFYLDKDDIDNANNILKQFGKQINIRYLSMGNNPCDLPLNWLNINSDGYIMPCFTNSDHNLINYGNIRDNNVIELWNEEIFIKMRANFGKEKLAICEGCPIDGGKT